MLRPVSEIGVGAILNYPDKRGYEVRWARVRPNGYVQFGLRGISNKEFLTIAILRSSKVDVRE